jgi:hypothetical protein
MDMRSREQYLNELRKEYAGASKTEKTRLLNEGVKRTHLTRKHLIVKLGFEPAAATRGKRKRKRTYNGAVSSTLIKLWELFDYPCGQRLAPLLEQQTDNLQKLGVLLCSDQIATHLKAISPKTIDRLLKGERARLMLNRYRNPALEPLLNQIPMKTSSDWNREEIGNLQLDFVLHCGQSVMGHYAHTLSVNDIATGWWEGQAQMGRSQTATQASLNAVFQRIPFKIREVHPDNDRAFINNLIFQCCKGQGVRVSRSRPLHKNDNAWVEQRNYSHIRKVVGYRRFDSQQACDILNRLYTALALFKNFFLPTMKLIEKQRVAGKVHRKYDKPKTPYQRVLDSGQLSRKAKLNLQSISESLNPIDLKHEIKESTKCLFELLEPQVKKTKSFRRVSPRLVRFFMTQPRSVWLGS